MSILFLIPPKTLSQTSLEEWNDLLSKEDVFFTAKSDEFKITDEHIKKLNASVYTFQNFNNSGLIEKKAKELHQSKHFKKIISTAEVDVLRSAKLRENLEIPGQNLESGLLFRDKFKMKSYLMERGIKVPKFKKIFYATDLLNFIEEFGFKIVVKPNLGAGSANTYIINDNVQLEELLANGLIDNAYGVPDLIAETFVEGKMYHVDGLVINNKLIINQPSSYINACIEFKNGTHLGSYTLDEKNPLAVRLKELNKKVLEILPSPTNFTFHAEYFHNQHDEIIFCEIACRLGGGPVKDAMYERYGINVISEYIKSEIDIDNKNNIIQLKNLPDIFTGFVLVPPLTGILKSIPDKTPFEWVKQYRVTALLGHENTGKIRTSGEITHNLITGNTESEMVNRINNFSTWIKENAIWE